MAISSTSLSSSSLSRLPHHHQLHFPILSPPPPPRLHFHFQLHLLRTFPSLHASRRQEGDELFNESQKWNRFDFDNYRDYDDDDEDDEEEEEEEDRSLDLLVRFVENIFRKISKRARKAVRSVLPLAISTKLVGFAVNGFIILSFLWVLKAFLEVVCTLGSVVFVSILLIRGVWSGVLYLQENRNRLNGFDEDHPAWNGAEPVT